MEDRLKALVEANRPENRNKWALRWKESSRTGKVLGVIGPYIPEEILSAAGVLPFGVSGTWDGASTTSGRIGR